MLTIILIAINLVISIIAFSAFRNQNRPERFLFIPALVATGTNYGGMVLSHFSHADIGHLFFNMMTMFFFAPVIEQGLGSLDLLTIYVLSGLSATLFTYYFHKSNPGYRALGASGSISGIIFASIVINPDMSIFFIILPVPIPAPIFAIGYIALSTYLMRKQVGNIGHEAHIGGALSGFLLAVLLWDQGYLPLLERLTNLIS
jgi:membrane associated rhomboid family serine protease